MERPLITRALLMVRAAHRGGMKIRYSYRLRVSASAERALLQEWGKCRWVWNQLVAESQRRYTEDPDSTFGAAAQDKFLTQLRATTTDADTGERWLAAGSSVVQQQTVRDFSAARSKALLDRKNRLPVAKRRGLPRFKRRNVALPTMNYSRRGFSLTPDPDTGTLRLRLAGGVTVAVVWSRALPADPSSVRVNRDTLGHWYASFVVDTDPTVPAVSTGRVIGVDWGVTETATTAVIDRDGGVDESTAFDLPHAEHGKRAAQALLRHERALARRRRKRGQDPSRGYRLAKWQVAAANKKIARQRADDAHKWAKQIAVNHDRIAVEDFTPKFLAQSTMARKAADAAIGQAKAALLWQATKHGREVILVNPAHTTMDCSGCDARTTRPLPLGERTYRCASCGLERQPDKNSALVMINRAGFTPASADGIRPHEPAVAQPAA